MPRLPVRVRMNKVRFRPPRQRNVPVLPAVLSGRSLDIHPDKLALVQRKARLVAEHMSAPDVPFSVQKLAKASWVKKPGEKMNIEKPFTLRELADPAGAFPKHGQLIFVFRHVRTNQILYSFTEVLDESHLKQIPFFAKHSTPPSLRRDMWTPHCVVSFPTPEQGHNAFRKLREFRKLHELCWDKTNPEWIRESDRSRMKKIMNQRANTSADLARVLSMQAKQSVWMQKRLDDREKQTKHFLHGNTDITIDAEKDKKIIQKKKALLMKGRLATIQEMAKLANSGEINRLAVERRNLTWRLERIRPGKNDKLAERLKKAILANKNRTDNLLWAKRRAHALTTVQEELEKQATEKDKQVEKLERTVLRLQASLKRLTLPARRIERKAMIRQAKEKLRIAQEEAEERAALAREKTETGDHHATQAILPRHLTTPLPAAFVTKGVEIQWADLLDGEYAKGTWPEGIVHTVLPLTEQRAQTTPMRQAEYLKEIEEDKKRIYDDWVSRYTAANSEITMEDLSEEAVEARMRRKVGLRRYLTLPTLRNPFKRRAEPEF